MACDPVLIRLLPRGGRARTLLFLKEEATLSTTLGVSFTGGGTAKSGLESDPLRVEVLLAFGCLL